MDASNEGKERGIEVSNESFETGIEISSEAQETEVEASAATAEILDSVSISVSPDAFSADQIISSVEQDLIEETLSRIDQIESLTFKNQTTVEETVEENTSHDLVRSEDSDSERPRTLELTKRRHMKVRRNDYFENDEGITCCARCLRPFSNKRHCFTHIRCVHYKQKRHKCPQCMKTFAQKSTVRTHVDTVHKNLRKFKCPECDRSFGQRGHLNAHVEGMHRDVRDYLCMECGHGFTNGNLLQLHMQRVHYAEKGTFKCEECDRVFSCKYALKHHVARTHEHKYRGQHPCQYCSQVFKFRADLKAHTATYHLKSEILAEDWYKKSTLAEQYRK